MIIKSDKTLSTGRTCRYVRFAFMLSRDVVLTIKVWERVQKIAILKQLRTHFKAKREKGVGTPFPRVPAPLHP